MTLLVSHAFLGQGVTKAPTAAGAVVAVPVMSVMVGYVSSLSTAKLWTPIWMPWMPSLTEASLALSLWLRNMGIAIAARMPMMMITIRSSMRVKPPCLWNRFILDLLSLWHLPRLTDCPVLAPAPPPAGTPNARSLWCSLSRWAPQAARWSSSGGSPADSMSPVALRPTFASGLPFTPLPLLCLLARILDNSFGRNAATLYRSDNTPRAMVGLPLHLKPTLPRAVHAGLERPSRRRVVPAAA